MTCGSPLPRAVHQGTVRCCHAPRRERKGVLQFLLGFALALLLLTEGGWETGTEGEEEMPSARSHSSDLGGRAVLELF